MVAPGSGKGRGFGSVRGFVLGLGLGGALGVSARGRPSRRLAREQPLELVLVDRLALDEELGDLVQLVHVLAEHLARALVRLLDHAADLVVDLARDLLGVVRLGAHVAAEERHVVVAAEHARAELLAHAVAHDHVLRRRT